MRTHFKTWVKPFIDAHQDIIIDEDYVSTSEKLKNFLLLDNLYLEIGPGKGSFMISLAEKFPQYNFLCIEKCQTIAGIFAKKVFNSKLTNVFIISSDVFDIFPLIQKSSICGIFLNHPDPWPKLRHTKRRLTSKLFLDVYKNILKDDSQLIFKTDNDDLFAFSKEELVNNDWLISDCEDDYKGDDSFDAFTDYQLNFISQGVKIKRLKAKYNGKK
ncbi:MAG: hypothetical protein RR578_00695 [Bacilli bacterium]